MLRLFLPTAAPYLPIVAEAAQTGASQSDLAFWLNYGACALILGWTMLRAEPRLTDIARAIDRLTRMLGLLFAELPHVIEAVKKQAREIRHECDAASLKRGEKLSEDP